MDSDRTRPGHASAHRRSVLRAAGALVAGVLASRVAAQEAARLAPTPSQPEGPYYPKRLPEDRDEDLVAVRGRGALARGTILHLTGTVRAVDGTPLAGARIEIWQCDANGRYHHVDDGAERERDPGFQGYGAAMAGADGGYRFRTIRPVPYPGRSPHIHVRVSHPAAVTLTTQMYVRGDPAEADSGWFRAQGGSTRDRLSIDARPAPGREAGALEGRFDLVLARR